MSIVQFVLRIQLPVTVHIPINVVTYMVLAFLEDEPISFGTLSMAGFVGTIEEKVSEPLCLIELPTFHSGFIMDDRPPMSYCTSR